MTQELINYDYGVAITPQKMTKYDCLRNAIITALGGIGVNDDYLTLGSWGFRFKIDERVHLGVGNGDFFEDLSHLKNVHLEKHEENRADIIFSEIQKQLEIGKPVIMYQDTYYNPWSLLYGKEHVDHYFVVSAINTKTNCLLCVDNYASDSFQVLTMEQMEKGGLKEYITIGLGNEENIGEKKLAEYLYKNINEKLQDKYSPFYYLDEFRKKSNLIMFAEHIENLDSSEELRKLARVRDLRTGFASDLDKLSNGIDIKQCAAHMKSSSKLFSKLIILIIKYKRSPDKGEKLLEQMNNVLTEIINVEKNSIYEMHNCLKKYLEERG